MLIWLFCAAIAAAAQSGQQAPRTITFSGLQWTVKRSDDPVGPGPNVFSDDPENVFVDDGGRLHLKITNRNGTWQCAEIVSRRSFGYGRYAFEIGSSAQFDPGVTWGLFTWSDSPPYHHREIDVELGRWANPDDRNAQFVIQPYDTAGNITRFNLPEEMNHTTEVFTWKPGRIDFQSIKGSAFPPAPEDVINTWTCSGADIPRPGGENVRINLWLFRGKPLTITEPLEVIVSKFTFQKP